jgi:hypothetical protein
MTRPFSLSSEQRERFERDGVVLIGGLLDPDGVRRARAAVVRRLARIGVTQADGWRIDGSKILERWPSFNVAQPLPASAIGGQLGRAGELEALGQEPALLAAAEALLDGPVDRRGQQRLRVLLNLPDPCAWTMPTGWHADSPRLASGRAIGVQLFAFLDVVEPGGGGTFVVTGSHRLLNNGRFMSVTEVRDRFQSHPFFRRFEAEAPAGVEDRARLLSETHRDGDVELKILELTGQPSDAYFTDLRLAHTGRPNGSDHPRMMITRPFNRADLVREVVEARR